MSEEIRKAIVELPLSEYLSDNYGRKDTVLGDLLDKETTDRLVNLVEEIIEDENWHRSIGDE